MMVYLGYISLLTASALLLQNFGVILLAIWGGGEGIAGRLPWAVGEERFCSREDGHEVGRTTIKTLAALCEVTLGRPRVGRK